MTVFQMAMSPAETVAMIIPTSTRHRPRIGPRALWVVLIREPNCWMVKPQPRQTTVSSAEKAIGVETWSWTSRGMIA